MLHRISSRFDSRFFLLLLLCSFVEVVVGSLPAVKRRGAAFLFRIFVREQQGEMQNRKSASPRLTALTAVASFAIGD